MSETAEVPAWKKFYRGQAQLEKLQANHDDQIAAHSVPARAASTENARISGTGKWYYEKAQSAWLVVWVPVSEMIRSAARRKQIVSVG